MRPRPSASQSGPPKTMASVKPQKAVPLIQPTCSLVRPNSVTQWPEASPRRAKLMAVTINATQLAENKREGLVGEDMVDGIRRRELRYAFLKAVPLGRKIGVRPRQ